MAGSSEDHATRLLRLAFHDVDSDGCGHIEAHDLRALFVKAGLSPTDAEIAVRLRHFWRIIAENDVEMDTVEWILMFDVLRFSFWCGQNGMEWISFRIGVFGKDVSSPKLFGCKCSFSIGFVMLNPKRGQISLRANARSMLSPGL